MFWMLNGLELMILGVHHHRFMQKATMSNWLWRKYSNNIENIDFENAWVLIRQAVRHSYNTSLRVIGFLNVSKHVR
jgi:hypothetical protein